MQEILKIKEAPINRFNNEEYAHFMNGANSLINVATTDKIGISAKFQKEFADKIVQLTESIRQRRVSHQTKELVIVDKERAKLIVYLFSSIRVERNSPVKDRNEAANYLYNETKNYKGIQNLPKRQCTQAVDGLLADLKKTQASDYLHKFGLEVTIQKLEEVNTKYKKLSNERAESQVEQKLDSPKNIRKAIDVYYDYLVTKASATNIVDETPESKQFVISINKWIEDSVTAYKKRVGHLKKELKYTETPAQ